MAEQERKQTRREEPIEEDTDAIEASSPTGEELADKIDDLLD